MAEKRVRRSTAKANNIDQAGNVPDNKIIGRPKNAEKGVETEAITTKEVFMQTPTGRLDKKTYQIFKKYVTKQDGTKVLKGKYRKLLKIEKGVKG